MWILRKEMAPRYQRQEGITSYLLASPRTCHAEHLATSLVEILPGGAQRIHNHEPEQIYYIIKGKGKMTVGDEVAEVTQGDCIFIPSGFDHGLVNSGESTLCYFSAAAPSFSEKDLLSFWPIKSKQEIKDDG